MKNKTKRKMPDCQYCQDEGAVRRASSGNELIPAECMDCGRVGTSKKVRRLNNEEIKRASGYLVKRIDNNPYEKAFHDEWLKLLRPSSSLNGGYDVLKWIVDDPTDRDYFVAASVIQWLGTNCGRYFLEEATEAGRKNLVKNLCGKHPNLPSTERINLLH